ncbi:MAG: glycine betaine ABC transporter substrate-binding protein [Actinobacteria bacterium]|nr:glycine betaine ABC transporter substrate-binding protein [Actinomycetota bacterium]
MTFLKGHRRRTVAMLAVVALLGAACGSDDEGDGTGAGGGGGGSLAQFDLSGAEVTVGSKEFTEQLVLGQITIQALEAAGATVEDETGLVGSDIVREALTSGDIDMYWEYTGTGWITHLGHDDAIPDEQEQYEAVAEEDLESNNIDWLEPAGFNNTYAIATREEAIEEFGVQTLSEFNQFASDNPDDATLCAASEFLNRNDGLPGLEKAYGFDIPEENIAEVEFGVIFTSVDKGDPCNFGEVFATDGRMAALGLTVLEDDKKFFPSYVPALNVAQDVVEQNPDIEGLAAELAAALDTETMTKLNAQVDVDGGFPEQVAEEWLTSEGFIE